MHSLPFGLTWADYAIIILIGSSVIISVIRGFVREVLSLGSWVAAIVVAYKFYGNLAGVLEPYLSTPSLRSIISFIILMIITLILGGLVNFLVSRLVTSTGLSGTDKSLGMIFGFARGVVLIGLLILLMYSTAFPQDEWWKKSVLIPQFHPVAMWLRGFLPDKIGQLSNFVTKKVGDAVGSSTNAPAASPAAATAMGTTTTGPSASSSMAIIPVQPSAPALPALVQAPPGTVGNSTASDAAAPPPTVSVISPLATKVPVAVPPPSLVAATTATSASLSQTPPAVASVPASPYSSPAPAQSPAAALSASVPATSSAVLSSSSAPSATAATPLLPSATAGKTLVVSGKNNDGKTPGGASATKTKDGSTQSKKLGKLRGKDAVKSGKPATSPATAAATAPVSPSNGNKESVGQDHSFFILEE
jgi:membrane protein required for colicin V production